MKQSNREKLDMAVKAELAKPILNRVYSSLMELNKYGQGIMINRGLDYEEGIELLDLIKDHATAAGNVTIANIASKAVGCVISEKQAWALAYYVRDNQGINAVEVLNRYLSTEEEEDLEDLFEGDTLEEKIRWTQEIIDTVSTKFPQFAKAWENAIAIGDEAMTEKAVRILNHLGTIKILKEDPLSQDIGKYFPALKGKTWEDYK